MLVAVVAVDIHPLEHRLALVVLVVAALVLLWVVVQQEQQTLVVAAAVVRVQAALEAQAVLELSLLDTQMDI